MDIGDEDWLTVRAAKLCLQIQRRDRLALKLSIGLNAALILFWWPMVVIYALVAWIALALFLVMATIWSASTKGMVRR